MLEAVFLGRLQHPRDKGAGIMVPQLPYEILG